MLGFQSCLCWVGPLGLLQAEGASDATPLQRRNLSRPFVATRVTLASQLGLGSTLVLLGTWSIHLGCP